MIGQAGKYPAVMLSTVSPAWIWGEYHATPLKASLFIRERSERENGGLHLHKNLAMCAMLVERAEEIDSARRKERDR